MKNRLFKYLPVFFMIALVAGTLAPAGAQNLKERFKSRLPAILKLKAQGIIGENNKGFLEYLGSQRPDQAVVNAENADRKKVYTAIAKQQGTSAAAVGTRRALQIAQKAKPGEMLQNAGGKWYKK